MASFASASASSPAFMVLIETAEDNVPVIAENPDEYELTSPEWREATDAEYSRYLAYWDAYYDAEEAGLPLPARETFTA